MADSVRERILQNVEATLRTLTVAAGYQTEFAEVARDDFRDPLSGPFPLCLVHEPDDTYTLEQNRNSSTVLSVNMALDVSVWISRPTAVKATPINAVIRDVLQVLLADPTRGGVAIWTEPTRTSVSAPGATIAQAAARLSFLIHYRHRRDDVTQAA